MTTFDTDAARAALAGLLDTPAAVPLEEPISVGTVIALAEQVSLARAERDAALARLQAIRATVYPLIDAPGDVGALAFTVYAKAIRDTTT